MTHSSTCHNTATAAVAVAANIKESQCIHYTSFMFQCSSLYKVCKNKARAK